MKRRLSAQFWIELTFAAASAFLTVLTMVWPDWIEGLFGLDPDGGSGSSEWGITLAFIVATVALAALTQSGEGHCGDDERKSDSPFAGAAAGVGIHLKESLNPIRPGHRQHRQEGAGGGETRASTQNSADNLLCMSVPLFEPTHSCSGIKHCRGPR